MKVLHLTAHLGGGVGKAISGLVACSSVSGSGISHAIACLEQPQKMQFVDQIRACGCQVEVTPDQACLHRLVSQADIVQLEWWNHPAIIRCLYSLSDIPMRLLVWCHVSGLSNPIIPPRLIQASGQFLFTSSCSYESSQVKSLLPEFADQLGVVPSSGGFDGLPMPAEPTNNCLSAGYIGSMNFAKLHPNFVEYLDQVTIPGFSVRMVGDRNNQDTLERQCAKIGKPGLLDFTGYTTRIVSALAGINVLTYLLNPHHYGTAENALLEAMAMGIVPVVLDNPAEQNIVVDQQTGLVVHSPDEFSRAISWLDAHPIERYRLGLNASRSVRERFSVERTEASLTGYYKKLDAQEKKPVVFDQIFGSGPADWFLACQGRKDIFSKGGKICPVPDLPSLYGLFEQNKGSVFHFSEFFPDNLELKLWAANLSMFQ